MILNFDVVIRMKEEQLNCLKEKLQEAKLESSFWENQEQEWVKKKNTLEKDIYLEKEKGFLKYAKIYDEQLLLIENEIKRVQEKKMKMGAIVQKCKHEIYILLQDRKKFEKLKHKHHDKD